MKIIMRQNPADKSGKTLIEFVDRLGKLPGNFLIFLGGLCSKKILSLKTKLQGII